MRAKAVLAAGLGVMLASCAGVYGPKGNDTGGIIPWSPVNQRMAHDIAQSSCAAYDKYAVLTTMHRVYGDYITYQCRFEPPRRRYTWR